MMQGFGELFLRLGDVGLDHIKAAGFGRDFHIQRNLHRHMQPATIEDGGNRLGDFGFEFGGNFAGTIPQRINGFLHPLARFVRNVGVVVDDTRYCLIRNAC